MRIAITVTLFLSLTSLATGARADDSEAQFDYGLAEMTAGRFDTGCPALESSYRADPRPGTLFTLAECDRKWGKSATALELYGQYLDQVERMSAPEKKKQGERATVATQERAKLEKTVAHLTVRLPDNAPAGTIVLRDGVLLGGPLLNAATPVDPGNHLLRVRTTDGRENVETVPIVTGDQIVIVAKLPSSPIIATSTNEPAPPRDAPKIANDRPEHPSRGPWIWIAGGVGALGLATMGVTGGVALSDKSTSQHSCNANGTCASQHDADAGNSARTFANVATVSAIVAAAGLGAALVFYLIERREAKASSLRGSISIGENRAPSVFLAGTF
jgi:hypothetical protein